MNPFSYDQNTVCWLPIDENIDRYARDKSGNSSASGVITNATWVDLRKDRASPKFEVLPRAVYNGHTYAVLTRNVEWTTAAWICNEFQGNLAIAETDEEFEELRKIASNAPLDKQDPTKYYTAFHIGALADGEDWYWLSGRRLPTWYWRILPQKGHRFGTLVVDPNGSTSAGQAHLRSHSDRWAYVLCEWDREFSDSEWNQLAERIEAKLDDEEWLKTASDRLPSLHRREAPSENVVSAMYFNGVNSRIDMPSFRLPSEPPITIEAIITPFWKPTKSNMSINQVIAGDLEGGGIGIGLEPNGKLVSMIHDGKQYVVAKSSEALSSARRTHIAIVWNGQKATIYIDGKEQLSKAEIDKIYASKFSWILGCNRDVSRDYNLHYFGLIHSFRISRAIRYERDFEPASEWKTDESTVLLFHFNNAKGDEAQVQDLSRDKHTAFLKNTRWVKLAK